ANLDERNQLYRQMTQVAMDESVRMWIASVNNSFPLSSKMVGVTTDLVAGPKTARTLRDAYIPGKSDLAIGNLWVWTERTTWNPIGGFGDAYSNDIWRNLSDPPLVNHPFTGLPVPFRTTYVVETAGPNGKLTIPSDAVTWNADTDKWVPVTTPTAKSK